RVPRGDVLRRPRAVRSGDRAGQSVFRDGRQPRQLAGQPLLGLSAPRLHQGQSAGDLLVVRIGPRGLSGRGRRGDHQGTRLGICALLHADPLGPDAAPDSIMKTILKLVAAALVANAAWHVGSAYASHYRFTDAVESASQFGSQLSEAILEGR